MLKKLFHAVIAGVMLFGTAARAADDSMPTSYIHMTNLGSGSAADDSPPSSYAHITNLGTGGLVPSGLTQGSVLFAGAGGVLSQDNANFVWDHTNTQLKLIKSDGGLPTINARTSLVVQGNATTGAQVGLSLISGATGSSNLSFGNTAAEFKGLISYDSNTDKFSFLTAGSGTVRGVIDSAGKWGFGTTSPVDGFQINNGSLVVTSARLGVPASGAGVFIDYNGAISGAVSIFGFDYGAAVAKNLVLNAAGAKVGIVNSSPQALLSIGTTAATVRSYNSITDASNSEFGYGAPDWGFAANIATFGSDRNGTGTARAVQIVTAVTASTALPAAKFDNNQLMTLYNTTLLATAVNLTNGAAAAAGTLLNAPAAGNPTKWVPINDNGTTRYIPAW